MLIPNSIIAEDLLQISRANIPWQNLNGLNILITGATGFIAGYLIDSLAYLNAVLPEFKVKIYALARNQEKLNQRFPYLLNTACFEVIIQDVCLGWFPDFKVDLIIHAASEASPAKYLSSPVETIKANTLGTLNFLEIARQHQAKFLFLSSGTIYGCTQEDEVAETSQGCLDPLHPRSCYAESKRAAESICMAYFRQYALEIVIARISHTYGPGLKLDDGRVFTDLIADALAERNFTIHGDGLSSRPFCYITDMVSGLFLLTINGESGQAYNIGMPSELTILSLAELIKQISGKAYLDIQFTPHYADNIRSSGHLDIKKISCLGWKPLISPAEGFKRLYDYFLALQSVSNLSLLQHKV